MAKVRISFTGDILSYQCQNVLSKIGYNKYDFLDYFVNVKPVFDSSDYVVGSLETPLAGIRKRYTSEDTNFNTPDDILVALKDVGVDMLTTGNNHCLDRGKYGLLRTLRILEKYGFDYTGTFSSPSDKRYIIKQIGDVKIAFLSYTYGTNSDDNECVLNKDEQYMVNLTRCQDLPPRRSLVKKVLRAAFFSLPKSVRHYLRPSNRATIVDDCVSDSDINAKKNEPFLKSMLDTIKLAKQEADFVLFCLHSGGQFNTKVSGYTKWLIDKIVDSGVHAVICNHTHTVLPIEVAPNGTIVTYSLGNFSFTPNVGYYIDGVQADYSIVLHLDIDKSEQSLSYSFDVCKSVVNSDGKAQVMLLGNPFIHSDSSMEMINQDDLKSLKERMKL